MKNVTRITILASLVFSLFSCSYNYERGGDKKTNEDQILNGSSSLSYAKINELVLAPRCLGCHSGKDEPSLTNYQEVLANKDKIFEQTVESQQMPRGKALTNAQLNALKLWLNAGAPENVGEAQNPVPSSPSNDEVQRPVSWEQLRTKVIERNCVSCHYEGNSDGISSYEDYETVRATIGTIFYTVAIQPVMPPAPNNWPEEQPNPNQLTREQKDLISAWIIDGMLP